ncbi:Pimeloyl-ACP methyl ester carboxylesterase [Solimonas aquatica]|uniref:Pimeloyl-ACP methyl ester carboxylesterase n=1 Tax=Solimonas aquatica TaxID=489703 RepID=A0A1H9CGQ7_9GAMM|nr:alpha/beta hydrolase [Solimonas aquatica]SEQ00359.1 Pimeloyl-ACP methyl ester carboxylesterase [Solimonas aquatica]
MALKATPPPGMHRAMVPGGVVEYREYGAAEAPPLLFVHGVLANERLWEAVAQRLAPHYRCILPTWPLGAHRLAMRPDADLSPPGMVEQIVAFMDALRLPRATLIGNDSGGALCQMLLARHPQRVERLVLTSCDAYEIWLPLLFKYLEYAAFVPGMLWLLAQLLRLRPLRRLPIAFGWLVKRMPRDLADALTAPMAASSGVRRDLGKFLRGISARYTLQAAHSFAGFRAPVLIAWSRQDRFFPLTHARRLQQHFPQARLMLVDDAYTFSAIDNPGQLAQHLEVFLHDSAASMADKVLA